MNEYEMRAEYEDGVLGGPIHQWHMTVEGHTTALCGHPVDAESARLNAVAWGDTHEKFCYLCGALYLRQVP